MMVCSTLLGGLMPPLQREGFGSGGVGSTTHLSARCFLLRPSTRRLSLKDHRLKKTICSLLKNRVH